MIHIKKVKGSTGSVVTIKHIDYTEHGNYIQINSLTLVITGMATEYILIGIPVLKWHGNIILKNGDKELSATWCSEKEGLLIKKRNTSLVPLSIACGEWKIEFVDCYFRK